MHNQRRDGEIIIQMHRIPDLIEASHLTFIFLFWLKVISAQRPYSWLTKSHKQMKDLFLRRLRLVSGHFSNFLFAFSFGNENRLLIRHHLKSSKKLFSGFKSETLNEILIIFMKMRRVWKFSLEKYDPLLF